MRIKKSSAGAFFLFLATIMVPSLIYVSLAASSMAVGILVVCAVIVVAVRKLYFPIGFINLSFLFFFTAFAFHVAYFCVQGGLNLKHAFSVLLLLLMFFSAGLFSMKIKGMRDEELVSGLKSLSVVVVFFGAASIVFSVDFLGYGKYAKAIFPFAEPSHYAITVGGILLASGFYLTPAVRVGLVLSMLLFSVLYPSMLLLLLTLVMLFSYYVHSFLRFSLVLSLVVVLASLVYFSGADISYYTDRLKFDDSTSNLTALVYMQGWEDAYRALVDTNWIGQGFQNMGSLDPGMYGERIFQILGKYKNREDGGFLAAKIVGEFGVLGLVFLFLYMITLLSSVLYNHRFLKAYKKDQVSALGFFPVSSVLGSSLMVAFSIELFTRGYGYFSPGILLAMTSFFLITRKDKRHSGAQVASYA
ncbi:hypothetical protein [Microbulbifer variabilis]|uniref:hypothetical protein n=1 Tax=Microbulbifer variabilis TaxID=266805 RepID=UPI000360B27B|nr:hypothetical protein [Microbulbifer variabilis]